MELLIGLLGGSFAAGVLYYAKKLGATLFVKNYGKVIESTFAVLDPIAGSLVSGYNESEVQQAVKLVVTRVADSELDDTDVVAITNYVIGKFNPSLAAAKVLDKDSEQGKASMEMLDSVKALRDGATIEEVFNVAKAAKALF
jgi:hypothetical protein